MEDITLSLYTVNMSRRLGSGRERSSSGGNYPPPAPPGQEKRRSNTTVLGKLKSKLSRQRSSQQHGGRDDLPPHPPLLKSSTLPARMASDDHYSSSPRPLPWGTASQEDSPGTDDESVDSGLDPRGGETSSDSSPRNQKLSSIYDEVSVQRAFGPAMKDVGRWFSQRQYLSLAEAAENDRLGSRPPLPLPTSPGNQVNNTHNNDLGDPLELYGRVQPRLLGSNGLELGLRDLAQYGWYWGPMTRLEAEERLTGSSDGTFLVRDSSDDRYLLSLSFRSQGKTLHTRIEFCNGHFSFYSFPDSENEGYTSVAELIQRSMQYSSVGVFCFSRARTTGSPAVPVRLLKPLSRFSQLRSLQHYCRFVIRQAIRFDSIRCLPLPRHVHTFLEQSQF